MTEEGTMKDQDRLSDLEATFGDAGTQEAFDLFLKRIPGGVFRYKADGPGYLDFVSDGLLDLMGCKTRAELDELTDGCFSGIVHPADRQATLDSIEEQISYGDTDMVIYRLNRPDDAEIWVDDRGRIITDANGVRWFYVTLLDITQQVEFERELKRANERMEILTALSNDIIFDIECATGHTEVFGDFEERFSRAPRQEDFVVKRRCRKKDCSLDIHTNGLGSFFDEMNEDSLVDFETSTEGPDGSPVWYRYQSVVLYDDEGHAVRHVGRLLDTHDMMMRESQFRRKAERDSLTGLYNRSAVLNRIEPVLQQGEVPYTFFLIDVDDFKDVNDTYGHPEGDRVLIELGSFLTNAMRQEDVVARLGGDEFAVFAKGLEQGPALDRILEHLTRGPFATQRTTDESGLPVPTPSISVGAVSSEGGSVAFEDVYAAADAALYEAKQRGKSQACAKELA